MVTIVRLTRIFAIACIVAVSGCASQDSIRMASNQNYCPAGTVMVCSGMYGVEDEITPKCGCSDMMGALVRIQAVFPARRPNPRRGSMSQ